MSFFEILDAYPPWALWAFAALAASSIWYLCFCITQRMNRNKPPSFDEMCQAYLLDIAQWVDDIEEEDRDYNKR